MTGSMASGRRVLLKLSGEALEGRDGETLDARVLAATAAEIKAACAAGVQVAVVIGGGNLFRGLTGAASGMERSAADTMGMLATVMNCIALADALCRAGQDATVLSAIPVVQVCEPFSRRAALAHLGAGHVVLCAGGTGNPYFTTDTAAALRALEVGAQALLKATKVDGIYDRDPAKHADAKRFARISYSEVLERRLGVMDLTAVTLCRENRMPLVVFEMNTPGNIRRAALGDADVGTCVVEENQR